MDDQWAYRKRAWTAMKRRSARDKGLSRGGDGGDRARDGCGPRSSGPAGRGESSLPARVNLWNARDGRRSSGRTVGERALNAPPLSPSRAEAPAREGRPCPRASARAAGIGRSCPRKNAHGPRPKVLTARPEAWSIEGVVGTARQRGSDRGGGALPRRDLDKTGTVLVNMPLEPSSPAAWTWGWSGSGRSSGPAGGTARRASRLIGGVNQ